jgi:hypothetical protein
MILLKDISQAGDPIIQPSDLAGQVPYPGWMLLLLIAGILAIVARGVMAMVKEGSWPPWITRQERERLARRQRLRVVQENDHGPAAQ